MEMTPQQLLLLLGMKEAEIFLLREAVASLERRIAELEQKSAPETP